MRVSEGANGVTVDFDVSPYTSVSFTRARALDAALALLDWIERFEPELTLPASEALRNVPYLSRGRHD